MFFSSHWCFWHGLSLFCDMVKNYFQILLFYFFYSLLNKRSRIHALAGNVYPNELMYIMASHQGLNIEAILGDWNAIGVKSRMYVSKNVYRNLSDTYKWYIFELSVFWPSDREWRINELRFSDSISLSFKTRLMSVTCLCSDVM